MLEKCEGLTLKAIRYGDSSLILKVFTLSHGLRSFIVSTSRKRKGKAHPALSQVLHHVEMVYYAQGKSNLKRIKEAHTLTYLEELHFNPVKSCLCMFMAEVYGHLFEENDAAPDFFAYQLAALKWLEGAKQHYANWHLQVLFHNMFLLGFEPQSPGGDAPYFDLQEGCFTELQPLHPYFLKEAALRAWCELYQYRNWDAPPPWTNATRRQLLQAILQYYRLHVRDFGELKSLEILHEVLQ